MKIHASRCKQCSRTIIPPRGICPYCGKSSGAMTPLQIDGRGKILSYTTLKMPPDGFVPPLDMALVELDQGAVVLCLASDEERAEMAIGAHVTIDTDQENRFRFHVLS